MIRYLALGLLALLLPGIASAVPPFAVGGGISHVQSVYSVPTPSGTTCTTSAFPAIGPHHSAVGIAYWYNDGGVSSPTTSVVDNNNLSYTLGSSADWTGVNVTITLFYLANVTGAPTSFKMTAPATISSCLIAFDEYVGSTQINATAGPVKADSTTSPGTAITTTADGTVIWAFGALGVTSTYSVPSGYTSRANHVLSTGVAIADRFPLLKGTYTPTWTTDQPTGPNVVLNVALR